MLIDKRSLFDRPCHGLSGLSSLHDVLVRPMVFASLISLGRLSPRRHGVVAFGTAFASAVRMIHRVLGNSASDRPSAEPAHSPRFTPCNVFLIRIPNLPYRRAAFSKHATQLARG